MADDLYETLTRFHREIVVPDLAQRLGEIRDESTALRRDVLVHFDQIYSRFNRLEAESCRSPLHPAPLRGTTAM